jgi:hypothetical protein
MGNKMFGLKRKVMPRPELNGLKPCLSGETIFKLEGLNHYIHEIKNLVSCPGRIFEELYLATLYRVAELCQAMPYSISELNITYGLLEGQLNLTVAALKLRRGILLPKNAGAGAIALEEPQWTYAIFSGSLLKNLFVLQNDRDVYLYKEGERIGGWTPLSGSLYQQGLSYDMTYSQKQSVVSTSVLMAAILGRIIPSMAIRWLSDNESLFAEWQNTILHSETGIINNINELITASAKKLGMQLSISKEITCTTLTEKKGIPVDITEHISNDGRNNIQLFISWIASNITSYPEDIFRVLKGLFLTNELMDNYCIESNLNPKTVFLQELKNLNCLILNENDIYHFYAPSRFEDQRILRGIVVSTDCLDLTLTSQPINTYFQEHTEL